MKRFRETLPAFKLSIDEGSRAKRVVIGFGAGVSVAGHVRLKFNAELRDTITDHMG